MKKIISISLIIALITSCKSSKTNCDAYGQKQTTKTKIA